MPLNWQPEVFKSESHHLSVFSQREKIPYTIMFIRIFVSLSLSFFFLSSAAQVQWPAVSNVTRPWTRWWWEGSAVTAKDLTANLEDYRKAGLGGVEITPIYGIYGYEKQFIDFLS